MDEKREHRLEIVRKSQRKRRMRARENGLCVQCCTNKVATHRTLCARCLERQVDAQRRYEIRKRGNADADKL